MKKSFSLATCLLICLSLLVSSCTKPPIIPGAQNNNNSNNPLAGTCTITFNSNDVRTADSIHWDYYSGFYRLQAFIGSSAPFTLYSSSIVSGQRTIPSGYLFWTAQPNVNMYQVNSGTVYFTNSNDVISGTINATGYISSGTGANSSVIYVTFSNVKQLGS